MPLQPNQVRDKKTGQIRQKDPKRVAAGKKAAAHTKGKQLDSQHKLKISRGVKKANTTGKTAAGRPVIKRKPRNISTRKEAVSRKAYPNNSRSKSRNQLRVSV